MSSVHVYIDYFDVNLINRLIAVIPRKKIMLSLKAEIVKESQTSENLKRTPRKYDVQPCQIREWLQKYSRNRAVGPAKHEKAEH